MVYYTQAGGGYLASAIANVLSKTFNTVFDAVTRYAKRRATYAALAQLSDRELNDIGLNRFELEEFARR